MRFGRRFLFFAVGYTAICSLTFARGCSEAGGGKLLAQAAMDESPLFSEDGHGIIWRVSVNR